MSQVSGLQPHQSILQQTQTTNEATGPQVLRNARPSGTAVAGRVIAGIITLGISEGIRAIVVKCRSQSAPAPRTASASASIPAATPNTDQLNTQLADSLKGALAPAHAAAVREAFDELRAAFGQDTFTPGTTFKDITHEPGSLENQWLRAAAKAVREAESEVTPQELKNIIKTTASPLLADASMAKYIAAHSTGLDDVSAPIVRNNLLRQHPELKTRIATCCNEREVAAILDQCEALEPLIRRMEGKVAALADATQRITREFAQLTGTSTAHMRAKLDLASFNNKCAIADSAISEATASDESAYLERIRDTCQEIATKFIDDKSAMFRSVDGLAVSDTLKTELRNSIFTTSTMTKPYVLERAEAAASKVDAGSLERVLREPEGTISHQDIYNMFKSTALRITQAIESTYTQAEIADLGGDGQGLVTGLACQILLDKNPGIAAALRARPELAAAIQNMASETMANSMDVLGNVQTEQEMMDARMDTSGAFVIEHLLTALGPDTASINGHVAETLCTIHLDIPYAAVVRSTLADLRTNFGEDCLPAGTDFAELAANGGRNITNAVEKRVRALEEPISAERLGEFVRSAALETVSNVAAHRIISERCATLGVDASRVSWMLSALKAHYPDLNASMLEAENQDKIAALLENCEHYETILQRESNTAISARRAMDDACSRLGETLGVPASEVPNILNLDDLRDKINITARAVYDDGNTAPDGNVADISARFQAVTDRFVNGKTGLLTSLEHMPVSPELKANWREQVLSNISLKAPWLLQGCMNIAERMNGASLLAGLKDSNVDDADLLGLVKSLGAQIDELGHDVFTQEQYAHMGSDETSMVSRFAREAFLDRNPELATALRTNPDLRQRLQTALDDEMNEISARMMRTPMKTPAMAQLRREFTYAAGAIGILASAAEI